MIDRRWRLACRPFYRYMEWLHHEQVELYDVSVDPYALQNVAGDQAYAKVRQSLADALHALEGCAGTECSWTGRFPPPV